MNQKDEELDTRKGESNTTLKIDMTEQIMRREGDETRRY